MRLLGLGPWFLGLVFKEASGEYHVRILVGCIEVHSLKVRPWGPMTEYSDES